MSSSGGWIGCDLDGTLALYDHWRGPEHIGEPVPLMLGRVKGWLDGGQTVKIFTARVSSADPAEVATITGYIHAWLRANGLPELEVTCRKDYGMIALYDDRAVRVIENTGRLVVAP